mmetsp:Transcript_27014/g.37589  ORF Transcript_27014/g.37589 Transcript_27014/m.37589 type:complete len:232 (-) Transcript_27014:56-751(-)
MSTSSVAEKVGLIGGINDEKKREYFTPLALLKTPFLLGQLFFSIVVSFSVILFFFWLLFVRLGSDGYECFSVQVLCPLFISTFASPVLSLAFAPIGMMRATERGWFGFVRQSDLSGGFWVLFPGLNFERGVARHLILGCQLAVTAIPIMLVVIVFGIADDYSDDEHSIGGASCYLTNWQQVLSHAIYIAVLPLFSIPIGLLGFAREKNLDRVFAMLSGKSFFRKVTNAPLC